MTTTTILMLGAAPRDHGEVGLDGERARIEQVLKAAPSNASFKLRHVFAFQPSQLQSELTSHNPQIVHFSGHGTVDGRMIAHGEAGTSRQIDPVLFANVLVHACETVRCVFLNACFGAEQAASIAEVIDVVVGPERELSARGAAEAAAAFYQALCHGRSVVDAVALANDAPELCGHGAPRIRLFSRQGKDPAKVVFAEPWPPRPSRHQLKNALEDLFAQYFTGRELPVVLARLDLHAMIDFNANPQQLASAAADWFVTQQPVDSRWFDEQINRHPRAKARGRAFARVKELWMLVMEED